jgi:quercetin dioxygenase-like cupin family protein
MTVDIRPFPRLGWDPLPGEGVVGVVGRVLVREDDYFVAQLRFAEHATIHPHAGENDTIVVCIEGEGYTSVGEATSSLHEGQQVRWPKGIVHGLWTTGTTMSTLMIEHTG